MTTELGEAVARCKNLTRDGRDINTVNVNCDDLETILAELGRLSSTEPYEMHAKSRCLKCGDKTEVRMFTASTKDEALNKALSDASNLKRQLEIEKNRNELLTEDIEAFHLSADKADIPRHDESGKFYSMWGRAQLFTRPPALGELSGRLAKDWRRRELDIRMGDRPNLDVQEILLECADELEAAARAFLGKVDG